MTPAHKPLKLHTTRHGQAVVVQITGSASMAEADHLRQRLEELAAEQVPVIVLDMSQMDFISSLGLGAIISGHLRCRHHRGQIRLVNPTGPVRELLETTRLTTLFDVYASVQDAIK